MRNNLGWLIFPNSPPSGASKTLFIPPHRKRAVWQTTSSWIAILKCQLEVHPTLNLLDLTPMTQQKDKILVTNCLLSAGNRQAIPEQLRAEWPLIVSPPAYNPHAQNLEPTSMQSADVPLVVWQAQHYRSGQRLRQSWDWDLSIDQLQQSVNWYQSDETCHSGDCPVTFIRIQVDTFYLPFSKSVSMVQTSWDKSGVRRPLSNWAAFTTTVELRQQQNNGLTRPATPYYVWNQMIWTVQTSRLLVVAYFF